MHVSIKAILILLLPLTANAASPTTHVHYQETIKAIPSAVETMKKSCDHGRKMNALLAKMGQPPLANYKPDKLFGNASLIGTGIKDEYWSHDGTYHAKFQMTYTTTNEELPMCQLRVVPKIAITYNSYRTLTQHTYSRKYVESSASGWDLLKQFKAGKFEQAVGGTKYKEYWTIKKLPSKASAEKMAAIFLPDEKSREESAKKIGEDKVLGRTCTNRSVTMLATAGMNNSACGWDNAGGVPDTIIAKSHLTMPGGGFTSSIAEALNLNASTPLTTLRPPTKWRNKPVDSYEKSKKTKQQWMNSAQLEKIRRRAVEKRKSLSQEEVKRRNRIRIETGRKVEY